MSVTQDSRPRFALTCCSTAALGRFAALVLDERVLPLLPGTPGLTTLAEPLGSLDPLMAWLEGWPARFPLLSGLAVALAGGKAPHLERAALALGEVRLHAPVQRPRQIFCSGANYKKHVVQLFVAQTYHKNEGLSPEERLRVGTQMMDERAAHGTPFFFCKAAVALTGPFDPVVLPTDVTQPDWELELGVVIGKPARRVSRERALDYVAGYLVVNDITARDRVNRRDMKEMGMDWVASKCAPTFLPTGPYLVPAAFVPDPQSLRIELRLNGATMQDESTADMIFDVARQIETLSRFTALQPGDLICTGSPAGNGMHYGRFLAPGDLLEGTITGLGTQRNPCVAEAG